MTSSTTRLSSPPVARRMVGVALALALALAACGSSSTASPDQPTGSPSTAPTSAAASQPAGTGTCPTSAPAPLAAEATATVTLTTEKGNIVIQVKGSLGPNAAGNFVALADCGYFNGVVFHRLVPGFVIQGGDGQYGRQPNVDATRVGSGGPGYAFADDQVSVSYARGTVAMANSGANTNGSQFFICLADLSSLAPAYSVFGTVTAGMDVVDAIAAMPNSGGDANQALQPVAITATTVTRP